MYHHTCCHRAYLEVHLLKDDFADNNIKHADCDCRRNRGNADTAGRRIRAPWRHVGYAADNCRRVLDIVFLRHGLYASQAVHERLHNPEV